MGLVSGSGYLYRLINHLYKHLFFVFFYEMLVYNTPVFNKTQLTVWNVVAKTAVTKISMRPNIQACVSVICYHVNILQFVFSFVYIVFAVVSTEGLMEDCL